MTPIDQAKAIQTLLGVVPDGVIGPKTEAAWQALKDALHAPPVVVTDAVDTRSEGNIKTLLPEVQPLARKLIHAAAAKGITMIVTSGTRTYEEQDALYEQGRSKPGNIVTNARGGYSNHNFGIAFDLTEFKNGVPVWDSLNYKVVGELGKTLGLSWGGDWKNISDEPHYELRPTWAGNLTESQMLGQLRYRKDHGEAVFA